MMVWSFKQSISKNPSYLHNFLEDVKVTKGSFSVFNKRKQDSIEKATKKERKYAIIIKK